MYSLVHIGRLARPVASTSKTPVLLTSSLLFYLRRGPICGKLLEEGGCVHPLGRSYRREGLTVMLGVNHACSSVLLNK